jgi:hypothetical protein
MLRGESAGTRPLASRPARRWLSEIENSTLPCPATAILTALTDNPYNKASSEARRGEKPREPAQVP